VIIMKRSSKVATFITRALLGAALLALFAGPAAGPLRADDRDLLREAVGDPYLFILLDTSGSMHWTPKCPVQVPDPARPGHTVQVPANANDCAVLCPTGDCFVQRNGDSPQSKFYQAKQALYEVLESIDGIQFGFGTYNQDALQVAGKHWVYQATGNGPDVPGYGPFPGSGAQEIFGLAWACDNGTGDSEVSCTPTNPADLNDTWEVARLRRLSKAGQSFTQIVTVYLRTGGETYRLRYEPQGTPVPGANVTMRMVLERCKNAACSSRDTAVTQNVVFQALSEFVAWDNVVDRNNPQQGYFTTGQDPTASNTCSGWDPNTDTPADTTSGYSLRWPTQTGDSRGSFFDVGDVVPLDWNNDHKSDILKRLAPNTALAASATPDFSVAPYLRDVPNGSETFLRLKDERARPLIASGSTPLGYSVRAFRKWYAGCEQGTCPRGQGWSNVAAAQDPDWGCRRKFLLVITDGDDTCTGADPCSATASLRAQEGIITYVVAFGVENTSGNKLNCMAANGGSGNPIYPQNKDELVKALTDIFGQIKEEASAFASAAVPSVQAEVADRIYLSSFTPLNGESVWDGHLDAFLKPLPLDAAGRPNKAKKCSSLPPDERSSCHVWDAAEVLRSQAPDRGPVESASPLDSTVLKLGLAEDQRRVFYGKAPFGGTIPRSLRLFGPPAGSPASDPDWTDLFNGLGISTANLTTARQDAEKVLRETLVIKDSAIGATPIRYVLGDIFHSDPVVVDRPNDFFNYASNLEADKVACGYRCYADKLRYRRKMLVVGSNDGQLHFFDAGIWDETTKAFDNGSGTEIFSFMPRLILPAVRQLAVQGAHVFGIDGTPRVDDVFVDVIHNGTPTAAEREWRTVVLGGFREGGSVMGGGRTSDLVSGYYALDITQPDRVTATNKPVNENIVPGCLSLNNQTISGCGSLPFPALLWEFTDSTTGSRWDEDLNGQPDLGETWSVPTVGRIRVTENGTVVEKFVGIFGGGMDPANKTSPKRGTWLYMVDMETGQAIYKRRLVGSAAADPAAVDVDLDGFLDVLYVGTTSGFLYKVNLATALELKSVTLPRASALPALAVDVSTKRLADPNPGLTRDEDWDPVPIFDTIGRPIFYAPIAFYVASLNRFVLAFGTGDRENLWGFNGQEGRFYMILDDNFTANQLGTGYLPLDETSYIKIDPETGAPPGTTSSDFLVSPETGYQRGWFMALDADERVITQAFGLAGIIIFSGYKPQVDIEVNQDRQQVCSRGGDSRIFVVYANNAGALMTVDGARSRYRVVPEFVTNPYVEQSATKNPNDRTPDNNSEQLSPEQLEILATLKKLFPPGTKFGNYWISVSGIRSDTGYERYATIPIGIVERNWKEH
jgi:Neisseria PilC beta-propeller domain